MLFFSSATLLARNGLQRMLTRVSWQRLRAAAKTDGSMLRGVRGTVSLERRFAPLCLPALLLSSSRLWWVWHEHAHFPGCGAGDARLAPSSPMS
jgi:hypothetical protein